MATRADNRRLLPGFGLTMGVTLVYVTIIIVLPLAAMLLKSASLGWPEFWRVISSRRSISAYWITFSSAALATLLNAVFGLLLAWVLARYRFAGNGRSTPSSTFHSRCRPPWRA